ncbi:hypothetical protein [Georgenia yuyongxinii]|uniref:Uncharacterized protein n=1 Tax=Georgenia yuyongxinii TaxID=2589797 RepID=A0A552WUL3_9MICO|nr:hypothetical protein [Georgenia yuyongxinii]TRW46375.1 hypothetical protein FJ693_05465 [Georgenia yuyongxinii]
MTDPPEPAPGRPISLGRETDLADAATLLTVLLAVREASARDRTGVRAVLRPALWAVWEQPRLPRPLVSGRYPTPYPWSPRARSVYRARSGRGPWGKALVLEHLVPIRLVLDDLLTAADTLAPASLVTMLEECLCGAVVSRHEDEVLTQRGLRHHMAIVGRPTDPWARYRWTGIGPDGFRPLTAVTSPDS